MSDPDDRYADQLGLDPQRFGPSGRLVTIGRVNALMVFKSMRDSLSAACCSYLAFSMSACYAIRRSSCVCPARTAIGLFIPSYSYLAGWAMVSMIAVVARTRTSFWPGATSTP